MTKQICVARAMQGWKTHVTKSWLGLFFFFTENDWSEESGEAFWEMVTDQLLVAKVTVMNTIYLITFIF